ncbi:unnamed protein product [Caenorhabditis bovis]|uniref:CBS domain-containing protein n=1 Tax=Caenorhabditis bovis TaxID=2654633 RepID=A0A8S1EJZ1_9PELO|nr:unnamed protein product [Caenorhabditis bovis]
MVRQQKLGLPKGLGNSREITNDEQELPTGRPQDMIEASPMNVYGTSMDHGYESGTSVDSSRRNSIAVRELPVIATGRRRYTMQNRMQLSRPTEPIRKTSYQSLLSNQNIEEEPASLSRRRMSVPENIYRRSEFAIMRPIRKFTESSYEVVSAFDRRDDPYEAFMKSITCYEMQPVHSCIVMFDSRTKIRVVVNAMAQHGHQAAVILNTETNIVESVFTQSDCLSAINMFVTGGNEVTKHTVSEFMKLMGNNTLICSEMSSSAWDAGKIIILNKHSCVLVFDSLSTKPQTSIYFLSIRRILMTSVLKLMDFGEGSILYAKQDTIEQKKIGTWDDITTVTRDTKIRDIIAIFVEKKFACIPVVNEHNQYVGIITRRDIITEVLGCQVANQKTLDLTVNDLPCSKERPIFGNKLMTIAEAVHKILHTDKQSLPIVNDKMKIIAIVSYGDILSYIQRNSSQKSSEVPSTSATPTFVLKLN